MIRRAIVVSGALALLLVAMPSWTPVDATETLVIGGTGSAIGVVRKLAEAYQESATPHRLEILPSLGTGGGLMALADGRIDIALAGRPLEAEERTGKLVSVFARTPLVFVANQEVTASGLSIDTLVAIYHGRQTHWPDGSRARPVLRPWHDAENQILADSSESLGAALAGAVHRIDVPVTMTTQENLAVIEQIPGAFGYAPLSEVLTGHRELRVLTFEQVEPTLAHLADGRYPLAMQLAMVTGPRSSADADAFIEFARSPAGAVILERSGCLPVSQ